MRGHSDKTSENSRQRAARDTTPQPAAAEATLELGDQRPESLIQRKMLDTIAGAETPAGPMPNTPTVQGIPKAPDAGMLFRMAEGFHSTNDTIQRVGVGSNIKDDSSLSDEVLASADNTAAYLGTGLTGPSYANATNSTLPEPHTGDLGSGGGTAPGVTGAGGGLAAAVNIATGAKAAHGLLTSKRSEKTADYNAKNALLEGGNQQLYAAVQVLEKEKDKAVTSDLENIEQLGASINGVINGITTLLNSVASVANTATAAVSAVTFGIGAGLNALVGTINGVRDSLNAHKRRMRQESVGQLTDFCNALLAQYLGTIEGIQQGIMGSQKQYALSHQYLRQHPDPDPGDKAYDIHVLVVRDHQEYLVGERGKIQALEAKMPVVTEMISGLNVAGRKLGYKDKAATAAMNLTGAAGGAALLAATIGGVAAAATPIGWGLAGAAAVGLLIWQTGKHVKRQIRGSNVLRMREERELINQAISQGTHPSTIWYRDNFPTEEKKGWFNRLTSAVFNKKKSGKMTLSERLDELNAYLAKYDTEDAGQKVYAGVLAALTTDQGNDKVDVGNGLEKTFREATGELLTKLGLDPDKIVASMTGDEAAKEQAQQLILQKMKLVPKNAPEEDASEADEEPE